MELERSLQKQIRVLQLSTAFLSIAVVVFVATAFGRPRHDDRILRVRGLIIEDDWGRERILIGAPIPNAKNRVRTDLSRVKSAWASRFPSPDEYIQSYKTYRNDMNGILILDSEGFDRVAVGDPIPDPKCWQAGCSFQWPHNQ